MGCVFVVFFWFPGGLEATKGPHSDARAYEAHHAAAGAAHCTARDNKTDADRRHERQRPSTHTHTHACATMCVTPRGRPPTDDSGERHPNGHESTRAQIMQATPPRDNQARQRTTQSTPPKVRSPASAEHTHTHAKIEQTPTHHGKKRRPNSGEHDDNTARVPASSGAAAPRSHRGDEIDDLTRATPSRTTRVRHIKRRQTEASGIAVVTSVTRESAVLSSCSPLFGAALLAMMGRRLFSFRMCVCVLGARW